MDNQIDFKFLVGDVDWQEYGGKFISPKFNNGDWDYWIVLDLVNVEGYEDFPSKYMCSILAVSPEAAGEENLKRAFESFGEDFVSDDDEMKVEALSSYGVFATLDTLYGGDAEKLLEETKERAFLINNLFGFFMDTPENMIGNTGWDFISGEIGFKF